MPYKGQLSLPFYIWIIYLFAVVISDIILNQDFKKYNLLNNNIFLNHEIYYPFKKMITLFENKKILEGMDNAAVIETLIGDITEKYNQKCAIIARDYINFLKPGEISLIDGIDGIDGNVNGDTDLKKYTSKLKDILLPPDVFDDNGNKIKIAPSTINACVLRDTKELENYPSEDTRLIFAKIFLKSIG